jgi:RNA polymerase sigma-70 factor (ECF subfamily)
MADLEVALVEKAQAGDRAAFEEMVRRTSGLVFARLYLETGDSHRTEDLLQETLLVAFRSLHKLVDPKSFRAWLMTIAQNVTIDAARHDTRKKRSGPQMSLTLVKDGVPGKSPRPDEQLEQSEQREQVLSILRSLPEDYRLPLTMRYIGGADYETIRMQLGLSNGSLRGLLHRGLQMLKNKMEQSERKLAVSR